MKRERESAGLVGEDGASQCLDSRFGLLAGTSDQAAVKKAETSSSTPEPRDVEAKESHVTISDTGKNLAEPTTSSVGVAKNNKGAPLSFSLCRRM